MTLIYLYTEAGHPSLYDTDVLHGSAGPHTQAKETLVTLIYLYTDAGHPSLYDNDVLHGSAGPHTESLGDPGDHDLYTCIPDA